MDLRLPIRLGPALPALAVGGALILCAAEAAAQTPGGHWREVREMWGLTANNHFGEDVASLGDVDGDGVPDHAVGAPQWGVFPLGQLGRVEVYSGADGQSIHSFTGPAGADGLGEAVVGPGDLDGDGVPDIVASAYGTAKVYAYSGATGAVLYEVVAQQVSELCAVPDVDGDGIPEFAAGSPSYHRIALFSGADGQLIRTQYGPAPNSDFGEGLAGLEDVDGDGFGDLLIGSPREDGSTGAARVYSGATGALIREHFPPIPAHTRMGAAVTGLGDLDGDLVGDYAVGAPSAGGFGKLAVYSGATGALLWEAAGNKWRGYGEAMGQELAPAGDLDRDGVGDLLVGIPYFRGPGAHYDARGAVRIFSGATGRLLHNVTGPYEYEFFGWSVAAVGDLTEDGLPEFLVGAFGADLGGIDDIGRAAIYSYNPFLYSSDSEISYAGGAPVSLTMAFPESEGSREYVLLASMSVGADRLLGRRIPVLRDAIFTQTLGDQALVGTLDPDGDLVRNFSVGSLLPVSTVGQTLYLAAVTLSGGPSIRKVSAALPLLILP